MTRKFSAEMAKTAYKLYEKGYNLFRIAAMMGVTDGQVRSMLASHVKAGKGEAIYRKNKNKNKIGEMKE